MCVRYARKGKGDSMTATKLGFVALVWALCATLALVWNAGAHTRPHTYNATLLCAHIAEDSAAHVRLIDYAHEGETLVYRCMRNGY